MKALNNPSLTKWKDIITRFLLIFVPLALFFGSLTLVFYYKDVNTARDSIQRSESYKVNSQMKLMASKFKSIITDLEFLASQRELSVYLKSGQKSDLNLFAKEVIHFSTIKKTYDRIQFLDNGGQEIIRIKTVAGISTIAPAEMLHNMASHTYFKETIKLPKRKVYISPFDLNHQKTTDDSDRPVISFSIPVVDKKGDHRGVIVLSHPVALLLEDLEAAATNSFGHTILVSPSGYYINSLSSQSFSGSTTSGATPVITDILGQEWQRIKGNVSGQFFSAVGLVTFHTVYPMQADTKLHEQHVFNSEMMDLDGFLWKTISFVPQSLLDEWPAKILGRIFQLYSVCLIIIAICSLLVARTVVRRKQAEMAMRENEEELRAINEAAANGIIVIDNNRNVLHWNPAAETLFQYSAMEVLDKPITSIIAPPKHQSSFTKLSRKFNLPDDDGLESKTLELFGYKKDGTEFPVEVSFSAFKKGEQWHTVGIIRDISARKKMEKEVLRANKFESLGVLSSGIAHDFNNLLTAILGNINLVGKLTGTPPDSLELLKNAEKAARRAKALTQQLLTFSKDGMPIRKTTSIESLIRNSVDYALHGSTIVSSFDIPEDLLLVDIDAGQIEQVFQNIVTNGRQAISSAGAVIISCRNVNASEIKSLPASFSGNYLEIAVQDTGHGMSEKQLQKIFDPYFTTRDHGSGLGLTIAHSIIQRHDGHITAESAEDKGSLFKVYLPAAVDQHPPQEKERKQSKGKHFKIMVVDNEEMLLNIAGRMLLHLGHECVCVKSPRDALDMYKHMWKTGSPVDGIIVDLTLQGGMGGKETAAAIFDINSEARIIVSSGYSNDPVMVDFDEYGFCAAIAKPFDMDELAEVIDAVLE